MIRKAQKVSDLARLAGVKVDRAVSKLKEAGLDISRPEQKIWRHDLRQAFLALKLNRHAGHVDLREILNLAHAAKKPASEVREILFSAKILAKHRLKRIPARSLKKAQELLGIK